MRILYVLEDYPVSSETYVETEILYFLRHGVEIAVWCRRQDPARSTGSVAVLGGSLREATRAFAPDVIHAHWIPVAQSAVVENPAVPVTVRAHSFEFNANSVRALSAHPAVAAVFLFPHLAEIVCQGQNPGKIVPLPVAYDERAFYPEPKERGTVVRATAGLGSKDIDSFLEVARACPEGRFTLITSRPKEDSSYLNNLIGRNGAVGFPIKILVEVPREEAAAIIRKSEICFRSNNIHGHPFGMPISIAESMGAGTIPVVRDHQPARGFVGDAGLYFSTIQQAVDRIREIMSDAVTSDRLSAAAVGRAKQYASSVVLPKMLEVWEAARKSK